MARPKIAKTKKRTSKVLVHLTDAEARKLRKAADKAGLTLSSYCRGRLIR